MANGHGGKRPGAGRPAKSEQHLTAIQDAEERISQRLPQLLGKLFELADGIEVQGFSLDGSPKVYTRAPCFKSLSYLVDRVMGRPAQPIEGSGPDKEPFRFVVEYVNAPAREGDSDPASEAPSEAA
jgi:hypothetical protein